MELTIYLIIAMILPLVILTIDKYFCGSALWEDEGCGAAHVSIYFGIAWPIGLVVGGAMLMLFAPWILGRWLFEPQRDE